MIQLSNIFFLSIILLSLVACDKKDSAPIQDSQSRSKQDSLGTLYTEVHSSHFKPPIINSIQFPAGGSGAASWGATGKDDNGNIYVGVSTYPKYNNTAFLYQLDPSTNKVVEQSDVVSQLKRLNLFSKGQSQNKIHSKIYQADDGYLYFTSFDEGGENASRGTLSRHGSHFWRKKPNDQNWEHLLATDESLIALNTDGRYVYVLGYWNHVLYQYDTLSRRFNRITVGSVNGHISRNFLVNANGRVFVPRIADTEDNAIAVNLMEYDDQLNLIDTHPLEYYLDANRFSQHGIISYINMRNGDIYFITGQSALYRVYRTADNKHKVDFVAFIDELDNPGGYFSSLFTIDGEDFLVGLGRLPNAATYSWFIHQISSKTTVMYDVKDYNNRFLLYGSATRDDLGSLYLVGVDTNDRNKHIPQLLQLTYPILQVDKNIESIDTTLHTEN